MTDKNTKRGGVRAPVSKEDIQLYRLLMIFGIAIFGFAALRLINESKLMAFLVVGKWISLVLLVLNIGALIYLRCIKKINEEGRIINSVGVSYFTISLFALLFVYQELNNSNVKIQVAFAFISLFAVIYNLFRREFVIASALTFLCTMFLYFIHIPAYSFTEIVLKNISYVGAFLLPVLAIAATMMVLLHPKKELVLGKRVIYRMNNNFDGIVLLVFSAILLLAAVLSLVLPSFFTAILIAILVIYVVVGMVCTIKLI